MKSQLLKISLLCILLLSVFNIVYAIENTTNTYIGNQMISYGIVYDNMKLDYSTLQLQDYNANDRQQLSTEQQVNEFLKQNLLKQINDGWGYVLGYLFLLKESAILLFFVIEMRFIIWFLVVFFPSIFLKLRDSIANFYKINSGDKHD